MSPQERLVPMMTLKNWRQGLLVVVACFTVLAQAQTVNRASKGDRLPVNRPEMFGGEVEEWDERANSRRIGVTAEYPAEYPAPSRPAREREVARPRSAPSSGCQGMGAELCTVFTETNRERLQNGLPAFKVDPACQRAADDHAQDMARRGFFSHTSPDGGEMTDRYSRYGRWTTLAENIAMGTHMDSRGAVQSWMKSPGHRRNILGTQYGSMGVGIAQGRGYKYFVQCFSK